jgi:hypothetical protein
MKEREKEMEEEKKNEGGRKRTKGEMGKGGRKKDIHEKEIMARTFW